MAEMKIGYGSEYQLLRYLGHHRNYLNKEIRKIIGEGEIQWFDYPIDTRHDSCDGELEGIECFKEQSNYSEIEAEWEKFWPQRGSSQNWDGIFVQNDVWYFVEAKAHLEEANQKCQAKNESRKIIEKAFEKTSGSSSLAKRWLNCDCYQLANRLAFIYFCINHKINASLLYINFINGYDISINGNKDKNVKKIEEWDKKWSDEYKTLNIQKPDNNVLKISDDFEVKIYHVYIDCHEKYDVVEMSQT